MADPDAPDSGAPPLPAAEPQPWGFWMTLLFTALVCGVFIVVQIIIMIGMVIAWLIANDGADPTTYIDSLASDGLFISIVTCVSMPICVALTWLLAWARKRLTIRDYFALKRVKPLPAVGWLVLTAACMFAMDYIRIALGQPPIPEDIIQWYETARFEPLLWFAIIVAAPVFEEALFRGFAFRGFAASPIGVPGAILLTALFWSALHFGQYGLVDTTVVFVLGLLLGWARATTGSLYVPLAMHALNNTISTIQVSYTIAQSG